MEDFVRRDDFKDFRADLREMFEQQRRDVARNFGEVKQRLDIANGRTSKNEDRIAVLERTFDRCPLLNADSPHAAAVLRQPSTQAATSSQELGWKVLLAGFVLMGSVCTAFVKLFDLAVTLLKHGN